MHIINILKTTGISHGGMRSSSAHCLIFPWANPNINSDLKAKQGVNSFSEK